MAAEAAFDLIEEGRDHVLSLKGDWTVDTVAALDADLRQLGERLGPGAVVDVARLGAIDVAGAYVIDRTVRGGSPCANTETPLSLRGDHASARRLLEAARAATLPCPTPPRREASFIALLDRIGRGAAHLGEETLHVTSFVGQSIAAFVRLLFAPHRIRWVSVVHVMEFAGLNAMPIIMLLSFFIGVVVAYLGARILGDFGASVFTVELVAFSVMREFGVVVTGVLLAGRTDSAFTAEIGAMKMRQEIDAMRVLRIDPIEALVVPRMIAMVPMTIILTFAAIMAGLFGGLLVCWAELGVSPAMYFNRIADGVPAQHFIVGMVKAPVFALVVALIGSFHGLSVGGDVGSLGRRVTSSVVQAIFLIILIDALFALWFLEMDI